MMTVSLPQSGSHFGTIYRHVKLNQRLHTFTTGHDDDFIHLLFFHTHRESSSLGNELPEESDNFRFLRDVCFANLKGGVGLIMTKSSVMRISIPLDLSSENSSRSFISRRHTPLLSPSLVLFPQCSV